MLDPYANPIGNLLSETDDAGGPYLFATCLPCVHAGRNESRDIGLDVLNPALTFDELRDRLQCEVCGALGSEHIEIRRGYRG